MFVDIVVMCNVCEVHLNTHSFTGGVPSIHPRNISSCVYVLCNSTLTEALGTAFVVSATKILTACHNLKLGKGGYDTKAVLVKSLEKEGKVLIPDSTFIPVGKHMWSTKNDWAVLKRTDGQHFPDTEILPICDESDINDIITTGGLRKILVSHCPVSLFNSGNISGVSALDSEKDFGYFTNHKILIQNGLFGGSSGGVYTWKGKALAIHVESLGEAREYDEVTESNPDCTELENLITASDSNVHAYAGMAQGLLICRYPIGRYIAS